MLTSAEQIKQRGTTTGPVPALVGPLGPAQLTCIRSWSRRGYRVLFVHVTPARHSVPFLRGCVDGYMRLHPDDFMREHGGKRLAEFLTEQGATAVSALSYSTIRRLHELKAQWPLEIIPWIVDYDVLALLESKLQQAELARECGLQVAETFRIDLESVNSLPDDAFPLALRPDLPGRILPEFKVELIADRTELKQFFLGLCSLEQNLVGQPFINGKNYIVHGVRCARSGQMTHVCFEVELLYEGVGLALRVSTLPTEVIAGCERFCRAAGIVGVYHFDLRRDGESDQYYFLEINGRIGGTTGKVYQLGFDEPGLMADSYLGHGWVEPSVEVGMIASNRQGLTKAIINLLLGRLNKIDDPQQAYARYLARSCLGFMVWRDEIYGLDSWRSSLAYLFDRFLR